ncbi:four helix bundle protein [Rhodohalobacter mucosus]|uniref:Four helix bundle protein n=1 Tax=Rhodohalobacter mucosus TaxID=2079485 RepID=A0A316TLG1_9BACT|nr:four helix bundle protein [Rhodohalobacter mucosus]PWN05407.1 four helix bundle protein [Rhodohalobacter mucosus]
MKQIKYDLENRLVDFGVLIIHLSSGMNSKSYGGMHLAGQLIRSGTSPGLHYGEAQSAESRRDFIHKMKLVLKELNESRANLKMIHKAKLHKSPTQVQSAIEECIELIKIFQASIQTARKCN